MPSDRRDGEIDREELDGREKPWKSKKILKRLYVEKDMTVAEIADLFGCDPSTVSKHNIAHGITSSINELDLPEHTEPAWRDANLMEYLYVDEMLSTTEISVLFDCSSATVTNWLEKHGIDRRSQARAMENQRGRVNEVGFHTSQRGYEYWSPGDHYVFAHRLLAVAEYGVDAVAGNDVHHINGIHWDNRPSNVVPVAPEDHQREHLKVDGIDRIALAEMYEHGDTSSRDLADEFRVDISAATVLGVHKEFYGAGS